MKKIIKFTLILLAIIVLLFGGFLSFSTLTDFQPKEKISLLKNDASSPITDRSFTILTWNIGYAGLGDNMDFFYDGGTKTRDSKTRTIENLNQIIKVLASQKNIDFMLLQEVDVDAKRSYYINEKDSIENYLNNYLSIYADNYRVNFVPVPLSDPMGYVQAGLQFLSKKVPQSSTRYAFPGNYSWPTSLFMLDRCFIANRYLLANGKDLIVIDTHNSAFDDGSLKKQQLEYLKNYLEKEYKKGNYFVVGGDWNQNPLGFDNSKFSKYSKSKSFKLTTVENGIFPKDWTFVFDPTTATNRSNIAPYKKGETATTVLDFFLLSPNLKANYITVIDLDFKNSDHQPVMMNFSIK